MSKEQVKKVNKIYRTMVIGAAAVIAICAMIYNPAHLFTAGLVYAFGLESEIVKADEI
jgi:hypothetical protein